MFETFGRRILDSDRISVKLSLVKLSLRGLGGLSLLPIRIWPGVELILCGFEGQTGAGKSYSMVGYGANKGIVPISCEEIFKRISANSDANLTYEVMVQGPQVALLASFSCVLGSCGS